MTQKPTPLPVDLSAIPQDLKSRPHWLLWRYIAKPKPDGTINWAKVPFQANGHTAKSNDPSTWCSYCDAADALLLGDFDGIGFAFANDDGLFGIDLDDCRDPLTGELSSIARELLQNVDGYAEVSPSGTGIKLFTRGMLDRARADKDRGIELYPTGRYFTVTGHRINGHDALPTFDEDISWFVEKYFGDTIRIGAPPVQGGAAALELYKAPLPEWDLERVQDELLVHLDPDCGYSEWVLVGMALHHQGSGDTEWLTAWDEWSAQSGKYVEGDCREKWSSFHQQRATGSGVVTLASLLAKTSSARQQENVATHPLLQFLDLNNPPAVPKWVLPGFVAEGLVIIAGAHGAGKTTAVLPLALVSAGIHHPDDLLAPKHWRHVVYIAEDVGQVHRILRGLTQYDSDLLNTDTMSDRLHLVEARRMSVDRLVQVGQPYFEKFTRFVEGVAIPPLVVLDTRAAVIAEDDENDNSGASKIVAALKQQFAGLPTWVIGHIAKANFGTKDVSALSMRGGSAFEADANQVLYLTKEDDETRFLVRGKTRFEASWTELEIQSRTVQTMAIDAWGDPETVTLRWSRAAPPAVPRAHRKAIEQQAEKAAAEMVLRERVLAAVKVGQETGAQLTKTELRAQLGGKAVSVDAAVDALLDSGEIGYRDIPKEARIYPQRKKELVLREMAFLE